MTNDELALLERAFFAEVQAALDGGCRVIQTYGRLAEKMVADGLLARAVETLPGRFPVRVYGFVLTHAGRWAYCATCPEPDA